MQVSLGRVASKLTWIAPKVIVRADAGWPLASRKLTVFKEDYSMKQYRLPVTMYQPSEETENKYMAEVPVLPGCRAWGDTPSEALENLRSVAGEFIQSYKAHGHRLPKAVEETAYELVGPKATTEVTVYI
jgi:predicted RNase H-like HicB family nuclease